MELPIQVLGDSYARRFVEFLMAQPDNTANIHCEQVHSISGGQVADIKAYLKSKTPKLDPCMPLLLFLGVNDILRATPFEKFKKIFLSIIRILRRRLPGVAIIISEIPYMPRVSDSPSKILLVEQYNEFFASLQTTNVRLLHTASLTKHASNFHMYYSNSSKKDLIHLNTKGYFALMQTLITSLRYFQTQR